MRLKSEYTSTSAIKSYPHYFSYINAEILQCALKLPVKFKLQATQAHSPASLISRSGYRASELAARPLWVKSENH